jgi:hypothetical protein
MSTLVDEMDTLPSTLGSRSRGLAFSLKTEQNQPGASYELREAAAKTKKIPRK